MAKLLSEKKNFKWDDLVGRAFEKVKEAISKACILFHPNLKKDSIIYCYASDHTMSSIMLQRNEKGEEVPISFIGIPLKKHELCYSMAKKKPFLL